MVPKKPLSEYTVAGLLFIGAQTQDESVKSKVLAELRKRQQVTQARKEAAEHNRLEQERLKVELEIDGLRSKDKEARRKANRDLFACMKDRAFEQVSVPDDLSPAEAVKKYNRAVHDRAKELYAEFKRSHKQTVIRERRARVRIQRAEYRKKRVSETRLKKIERAAYRNARFPLIGAAVYYTDTIHDQRQVGTVQSVTYRHHSCLFVISVKGADGHLFKRVLPAVEPVDNVAWFNEVRSSFMEFERWERLLKERDTLRLRVEMYEKRIAELDSLAEEYERSEFRRSWLAADDTAREFAKSVRCVNQTEQDNGENDN